MKAVSVVAVVVVDVVVVVVAGQIAISHTLANCDDSGA